jgi:hypothetical protein
MVLVDSGLRSRKVTEIIHLFDACQNTVTVGGRHLAAVAGAGTQSIDPERKCGLVIISSN